MSRFRIVVVADAADLGDKLQAVLDACKRADTFRDGRWVRSCKTRGGDRGQHVLDVVRSRQRDVLLFQYKLFRPVTAKHDFFFADERSLRHALFPAETVNVWF